MSNKLINFNMELHSIREWANILNISNSSLRKRLNAGESLFDIVKNPHKRYKRHTIKEKCTAVNFDECFNCKFKDCIRDKPIGGESTAIAIALRV